jgi:hypothetical protein
VECGNLCFAFDWEDDMVKKAERVAKALEREALHQQSAREEAAMQSFLQECRATMPAGLWEQHSADAERHAGRTFHVVDWMVSVLADTQLPITPQLRRALDEMLDALGMDRTNLEWDTLRELNYGAYWKSKYGY